ncbi:Mu-like prophage major head subunit gpT family protein [Paracoccus sp. MA]|uniref:phage major capsid protein n=1 Tax=Paracoccus sp. MA TaxID=2895796 RepID=UPI001E4901CF|nr:Mu-like prophage major head subunit gpT family protein [Paracoccus sp. MA]UFM66793.1 Mu-like prophage major head subunit gpT family protein [Paracoccus sp. MA]
MKAKRPKTQTRTARAATSYDEDAGTIEVIYATETPVDRYGYFEVLRVDDASIDVTRLDSGSVNFLIQHDAWGPLPIGTVVAHRIEDGRAYATIRLSVDPKHSGIVEDLKAGVLRSVSVGYAIQEASEAVDDDGIVTQTVTRWQPAEISLVSVPADPHARVRSTPADKMSRRTTTQPADKKGKSMKNKRNLKAKTAPKTVRSRKFRNAVEAAVDAVAAEVEEDLTEEQLAAIETAVVEAAEVVAEDAAEIAVEEIEDEISGEAARGRGRGKGRARAGRADGDEELVPAAEVDAIVTEAVAEAVADVVSDEEARADGDEEELTPEEQAAADAEDEEETRKKSARSATLTRIARRHGLDARALQSAVRTALVQRSPGRIGSGARIIRDERETTQRQAEAAVFGLLSGTPGADKDAGALRGLRMIDLARRSLGSTARGRSDREVLSMVLRSGSHSSSDFSFTSAASVAIERRVREIFASLEMPLQPLIHETLVSDFRPVDTYSIGGFPELKETVEGAEYEAGSVVTDAGSFRIAKFGRVLRLTFEALINDDLRLLDTAIRGAAAKGITLRNKKVREAFGAKLADNKPLFHASRGNLINDQLTVEGLSKARTALRKVRDLDGEPMNLTPKYVVVGPDLETEAQQLISPIMAAVTGAVNPFASSLELIVDPFLEGEEWMVAADPNYGDAIELADLRGYEGVRVEEIPDHLVDGLSYRARTFAGAHPTGWRGFVKSTGTGA